MCIPDCLSIDKSILAPSTVPLNQSNLFRFKYIQIN